MTYRPKRSRLLAVLPVALTAALGGCAVDGTHASADTPISGRQITQNAPAPDYTVFYWNALRACLQTGRSEWECKSGEQQFVRDALAVEAELNAQRRQRRVEMVARTEIPADDSMDAPEQASVSTRLTQSLMFDSQPAKLELEAPLDIPADLKLDNAKSETAATTR